MGRDDDSLMRMMMAFEFGVHAEELERNPFKAMFMSGRLFLIGSLPTVLPFFIIPLNAHSAMGIAGALVGVTLFVVGAYKCRTTKGVWWKDGVGEFHIGCDCYWHIVRCRCGVQQDIGRQRVIVSEN